MDASGSFNSTPAKIDIGTETQGHNHWSYEIRVHAQGGCYEYHVTLSWSDYDHWCHGRVAPQRVVRAALSFLLQYEPAAEIQTHFDCSTIRRRFPQVDQELPRLL